MRLDWNNDVSFFCVIPLGIGEGREDYLIQLCMVVDWAKNNSVNLQSATNKAIRGTIPAFRVRGHWMIDRDYTE